LFRVKLDTYGILRSFYGVIVGGACGTYGGTGKVNRGFWWRDLRARGNLEDLGIDGSIILKWIFKKFTWESWTGLIWLRLGAGGGRL